MKNYESLFLAQSYEDAWEDYQRSIKIEDFPKWDYVVLTASNENQAEGYRNQLEIRKDFLPSYTHFAVIPDEGNKRVGSGGATLSVIKYIHERELSLNNKADFKNLRILVIHSGGDSKRVPQYSALGKLFSPVPHELNDGRSSTLFDEFLIATSSIPSRIREGMLLLSGDVLLLFNPLQIDFSGRGAAAISFKENVEKGKNHGVFLNGKNGNVKKFLHKQTVDVLKKEGAVNEKNCVDIDTGAVIFSANMISDLYSLIDTEEKYSTYVNDKVRLSLYGDFLYPLAEDSTLEKFYNEKPEGEFCEELKKAREVIWGKLHKYNMKLMRLAPAKFIHFGTTNEIMKLVSTDIESYSALAWNNHTNSSIKAETAGYDSVLSARAQIGENCYLEVSYVHSKAKVGNNVLLSYIDVHDEIIPDGVVLHGLKQKDGKFVCRIYGVNDNPKENKLFGMDMDSQLTKMGVSYESVWNNKTKHTLWSANIYPECLSIKEAISAALEIYNLFNSKTHDASKWLECRRKSLCSGFNDADPKAIIDWNKRMHELVQMDEISKNIHSGVPATKLGSLPKLTTIQKEWLENYFDKSSFMDCVRMYYYLGTILEGQEAVANIQNCFNCVSETIKKDALGALKYNKTCKIVKDSHIVSLPLRVNWGGGWSDTPPICCEIGGTVLNAAISLNGKLPVEVTLIKIPEKKIVFDSRDMDVHGEFTSIEPLQETGDPYDSFALQKACLLACGIIPFKGGNLEAVLTRLGGGFEMHSEVTDVPKGSGLGTSSILSAACVKAVFEFMGIKYTNDDLYAHTLVMEQIMSTGGGWQDQVGGVTTGIKYITSNPGIHQQLRVDTLELSKKTMAELNDRFCLIYTGQRRLARNLLRDVVGRFVGNEPESLYALNEIQRIAALMRFELERGNIDEFAKLLDYHWKLSQKVDKETTNTLIDQIFSSIDDLIDGRMVCGAGGGGFLQVILRKGVSKKIIHNRLKEVFQDNPVDVWDCGLL